MNEEEIKTKSTNGTSGTRIGDFEDDGAYADDFLDNEE